MFLIFGQSTSFAFAGDPTSEIVQAIQKGDAKSLATHFNTTIDLELPGIEGNYSKAQAEVMMNDFFKKLPVATFQTNHKGSSDDGSKYLIGTYSSSGKEFRVYILLKKNGEQFLINQLHFEEE